MGGRGSTRWGNRSVPPRRAVEDCTALSTREALRAVEAPGGRIAVGWLTWDEPPAAVARRAEREREDWCTFATVRLRCALGHGAAPGAHAYTLEARVQPFGGVRWLWRCPTCWRACRSLYLAGAPHFRCRQCCRLVYRSQQLTPSARSRHAQRRIAQRVLPWYDAAELPHRRPGMHGRTYDRLSYRWVAAGIRHRDPALARQLAPSHRPARARKQSAAHITTDCQSEVAS